MNKSILLCNLSCVLNCQNKLSYALITYLIWHFKQYWTMLGCSPEMTPKYFVFYQVQPNVVHSDVFLQWVSLRKKKDKTLMDSIQRYWWPKNSATWWDERACVSFIYQSAMYQIEDETHLCPKKSITFSFWTVNKAGHIPFSTTNQRQSLHV